MKRDQQRTTKRQNTKIIGIDCAVDAGNIGLALGEYANGKTRIRAMTSGRQCDIVATVEQWVRSGGLALLAIDAPLGWPAHMGPALRQHNAGQLLDVEPNDFFRRDTDRAVKNRLDKQPLDVGADRIARTAHAALRLLHDLRRRTRLAIPLAWKPAGASRGSAIEVYPAATLLAHGFLASGYKKTSQRAARRQVVKSLGTLMTFPNDCTEALDNADVLDACVCVLAGTDFLLGKCARPSGQRRARKEGWIWVADPQTNSAPQNTL
jgi:hypothetical protein